MIIKRRVLIENNTLTTKLTLVFRTTKKSCRSRTYYTHIFSLVCLFFYFQYIILISPQKVYLGSTNCKVFYQINHKKMCVHLSLSICKFFDIMFSIDISRLWWRSVGHYEFEINTSMILVNGNVVAMPYWFGFLILHSFKKQIIWILTYIVLYFQKNYEIEIHNWKNDETNWHKHNSNFV